MGILRDPIFGQDAPPEPPLSDKDHHDAHAGAPDQEWQPLYSKNAYVPVRVS